MTRLINFLLYQIGWFACVLGAAWGLQSLGVTIALCLFGTHLCLAADRGLQIKLAVIAAGTGLVVDTIQLRAGVFAFSEHNLLPPLFMTVLWIQFASTFRYCMRWLSGRYRLSAFFGLLGAPLAFFAGERLGAIQFLPPRLMHYAVLASLWSVSVPLLVLISDRLALRCPSKPDYRWPVKAIPDGSP